MARYTGGRYWGFYTLQFTDNNWGKKGGTVYGGPVLGVYTLQFTKNNWGKKVSKVLRRARYSGGRYWGFYTLHFTKNNWGKKSGTVYGGSVLGVLHFTVHRK